MRPSGKPRRVSCSMGNRQTSSSRSRSCCANKFLCRMGKSLSNEASTRRRPNIFISLVGRQGIFLCFFTWANISYRRITRPTVIPIVKPAHLGAKSHIIWRLLFKGYRTSSAEISLPSFRFPHFPPGSQVSGYSSIHNTSIL